MASPAILLRPARPEPQDGVMFARYLDQAAEGFYGVLMGRHSERITATAFLESGHALSHENVMFAEREGRLVGMSLSYTGVQYHGFSDEPLRRAAGPAVRRMTFVRMLLAPLWRILESIPADDFYLHGIAVDPELRGEGVGSLLMNDVEEQGRDAGAATLSLDVSAKNKGARRLYARRGMIESLEWPSSGYLPTLFVHMTKGL